MMRTLAGEGMTMMVVTHEIGRTGGRRPSCSWTQAWWSRRVDPSRCSNTPLTSGRKFLRMVSGTTVPSSIHFSGLFVRRPRAWSMVSESTMADGLPAFVDEHVGYRRALEAAGVRVEEMALLDAFPDAVFVEDAALCLARTRSCFGRARRVGSARRRRSPLISRPGSQLSPESTTGSSMAATSW